MSPRVLTVGETMVLLDPVGNGALELGQTLTLRIAGAESNFAIALARLGVSVAWVSRVGRDPLGEIVRTTIEAEGVDVSLVRDDAAPTGLFFKWREDGRSYPLYYRRGSAASRLGPSDVPDSALAGVELVHLTGITSALGEGPRALVSDLARRAHAHGAVVTFDPNFRPALWPDAAAAAQAHAECLSFVDWYVCGLEEGAALFGVDGAADVVAAACAAGARNAVVRLGAQGAYVDGKEIAPAELVDVVDEVGAGDAFAAGFAYGLLQGWTPERSTRTANLLAAHALRGTGDWETLPRLESWPSEAETAPEL